MVTSVKFLRLETFYDADGLFQNPNTRKFVAAYAVPVFLAIRAVGNRI